MGPLCDEALPTLQTLVALADSLGVSPAELLGDSAAADDPWIREIVAIAETVPMDRRSLALDILRALARSRAETDTR